MRGEWKYEKLGKLCKTGSGGTPLKSKKEYYENGTIPWLRSGEVNNQNIVDCELKITKEGLNNSSAKLFPPRTILIAMYGATAGQVGILNFECSTNQAVCGIFPNDNFIPEFLYYRFLAGQVDLIKQAVGGAQPNISQEKIKNTLVPKLSIPEQKQIVAILDKAFAAIDQTKANIEKNIENAKELLRNWVYNRIIDSNWNSVNWGEICDFIRGPFGGSLKKSMFVESGYAVYEQKQAIHNDYKSLRYFINEEKFQEMNRFEVQPKDLLMSCSGVTLGRISEVPETAPRGIINQALLKLTTKPNKILNDFLIIWIRSKIFQDLIFKAAGGAAQPNVPSVKVLKSIKVPCPSINEQQIFIKHYTELKNLTEESINVNTNKLKLLEELKKSILQKAFSGELTAKSIDFNNLDSLNIAAKPKLNYQTNN